MADYIGKLVVTGEKADSKADSKAGTEPKNTTASKSSKAAKATPSKPEA